MTKMDGKSLTRRQFLIRTGAAGAGLMALGAGLSLSEEKRRPNIVFILSDDHRWDVMSCMRHPVIKTPNMDRLAKEGVRFSNAFVTISLCSPSRACFLTGKYAHLHGVQGNFTPFPTATMTTFPQILKKAGYETAFIGKWHMDSQDEVQPGFDRWVGFKAHGVYNNPVFNIDGQHVRQKGYMTDLLTKYATDWLKQDHKAPFLLYLAHKAPHAKCVPAERDAKLYSSDPIVPPASSTDPLTGKPEWEKEWPSVAKNGMLQKGKEVYEETVRNYYRTINGVDDSIGQVLETLKQIGQLENTIVIYCSDNGYYLGDHGMWDKRSAYDESLRIPFLVRFPKMVKPGRVEDRMILNVDLAPTLLDLAGVPIPSDMQGTSFRPLLEGKPAKWRDAFLYEYFAEKPYPEVPSMVGVRTTRWKYIEYPGDGINAELYDLKDDPTELKNLAQDPAYAKKVEEMKARLARLKKEMKYTD